MAQQTIDLGKVVGPTGPTGATGETGPIGPTGASGKAATITIGSVITTEADNSAQVTNSGTESEAILDFVLPQAKVDDSISYQPGVIYPFAGSNPPEGFLLCNGQEISRTEYAALFAVIGTTYGEGDGSTTFNIPDLQSRVPVGSSVDFAIGSTGGEVAHSLTVDELAQHNHKTGLTDNYGDKCFVVVKGLGSSSTGRTNTSNSGAYKTITANSGASDYEGLDDITTVAAVQNTGYNKAHNNLQPYQVVNYIIATGSGNPLNVKDFIAGIGTAPLAPDYGGTGTTSIADLATSLQAFLGQGIKVSSYTYRLATNFSLSTAYTNVPVANWTQYDHYGEDFLEQNTEDSWKVTKDGLLFMSAGYHFKDVNQGDLIQILSHPGFANSYATGSTTFISTSRAMSTSILGEQFLIAIKNGTASRGYLNSAGSSTYFSILLFHS